MQRLSASKLLRQHRGLQLFARTCRPFSTAFDPEKFSKRFETDTQEIENYFKRAEKQAWKKFKHTPIKPPRKHSENFTVSHRGFREIVLGDKVVNHRMVKWVAPMLWTLQEVEDVYCVVVRGDANNMVLPRGADYGTITQQMSKGEAIYPYFRDWCRFVYQFSRFTRPLISCMANNVGDNMAGLLVHTPYRIAFNDTVFRLGQTEQGFFPDSGMTYFLPRLDGAMGMYLALTGKKLYGSDLVHAGLATHFMERSGMPEFLERLKENSGHVAVVPNILEWSDRLEIKGKPFSLAPYLDVIDNCFSRNSVEEILLALNKLSVDPKTDESCKEFAEQTIRVMRHKCPLSLKVTHWALNRGAKQSFASCLKMEYRIAIKMVQTEDFKESCRALFDRSKRSPKWSHSKLSEVQTEEVMSFFKHTESDKPRFGADLELSLPGLDFQPDEMRIPKYAYGELFKMESRDPEGAELTTLALKAAEREAVNKDITDSKWFEFSPDENFESKHPTFAKEAEGKQF